MIGSIADKGAAALKVWKLAKEIGVKGKEDDAFYVNEIQGMEDRDHLTKVVRGSSNGAS